MKLHWRPADRLGVAQESVSRWMMGTAIQTRSLDRFMRIFFETAEVRDALQHETVVNSMTAPSKTVGISGKELRRISTSDE